MNKNTQRYRAKEILNSLGNDYFSYADEKITSFVLHDCDFRKSQSIFIYVSMKKEPNTRNIIKTALEMGKKIYVPKCISNCEMVAVRMNGLDELSEGSMGISEPNIISEIAELSQIDIVIVPCMSASYDGRRLGHGAGYYDRFLKNEAVKKICLCYDRLIFDDIAATSLDVKMDKIITENMILHFVQNDK